MNAGIIINITVADICEVRKELILNDAADLDRIPRDRNPRNKPLRLCEVSKGADALWEILRKTCLKTTSVPKEIGTMGVIAGGPVYRIDQDKGISSKSCVRSHLINTELFSEKPCTIPPITMADYGNYVVRC